MARLAVQIVNGDPEDVDALIEFLREKGFDARESETIELAESAGIGDVIVQVVAGMSTAVAVKIASLVQTWIRDRYRERRDRPSGPRLLGPDGEPLDPG